MTDSFGFFSSKAGVGGGGGVDATAYRLPNVGDDPGDIAKGTFGDELEYANLTAFKVPKDYQGVIADADVLLEASDVFLYIPTGIGGFHMDTGGALPTNFEYAALISDVLGTNGMIGPLVANHTTGLGIAAIPYQTVIYGMYMDSTAFTYSGTGPDNGGGWPSQIAAGRPYWISIQRVGDGTHWRIGSSVDGAAWQEEVPDFVKNINSYSVDALGVGKIYDNADVRFRVHREVYGTPTLGLGW